VLELHALLSDGPPELWELPTHGGTMTDDVLRCGLQAVYAATKNVVFLLEDRGRHS
jgi:hypothetical protein